MTTTLRPIEPLQHNADGTRSRRYQVCVNSRPVGAVHLGTHPALGDAVARILDLRIEEPDRRRGRGTVAALAAEEVVRGWRCRRIEAAIPADAGPALSLATALGYVPGSRLMEKRVGDAPPGPPAGSRLRPMAEAEFAQWRERVRDRHVRGRTAWGVPVAEARALAESDHTALLSDGLGTPGMTLAVLEHEGVPVGTLWLGERDGRAFVYDVETDARHRGRGHGRTLMHAAEARAVAAGRTAIRLDVLADNAPAVRLYTSLGYRTLTHHLRKELL
ncbi:GNAT family N-acetyltransferase [Streptomyces poonensis]|uniref:N-acetyltransferase n=1 Tax=Streptomyces poonensis TaxID=68255 RepID=A0A918PGG3_9ACTN|nr:GNAT family N-acetyltransferase [Streptomyces poonensis]GGZ08194.1 N-acetyltransferase [Streptomyces poonensis]GLJ90586.1 N-acetyltransferase [Streptomyces poonensis]